MVSRTTAVANVKEDRYSLYSSAKNASFQEGFAAVVNLLKNKKNIIVLTGAGISVSCGIPDFRSKGTGLYSTLDAQNLGLSCPEELFDYEVFHENPQPFFRFAKNLYFPLGQKERARPSDAHKLLSLLEHNKMLLRVYSQNIDGLEQEAGVSPKRVVYAHGSLQWATCIKCKNRVSSKEIEPHVLNGTIPRCQEPVKLPKPTSKPVMTNVPSRGASARIKKRQRDADVTALDSSVCGGVFKPGVTFFGEALHDNVRRSLEADRNKVDALIVIGTSLSVAPISKVVGYLPPNIPRILINRTIVHPGEQLDEQSDDEDSDKDFREDYVFDAYLLGFCDDVARVLAKQLFYEVDSQDVYKEGKLLSAIDEQDDHYKIEDWLSCNVPKERIFLFPGAEPPSNDDDSVLTYREVAQCDGCSARIVGTIYKCANCFDYDLCSICHPELSKTHGDGKHHFVVETASECDIQTQRSGESDHPCVCATR